MCLSVAHGPMLITFDIQVTAPVNATVYSGGKPATVTWQEGGSSPSLKQFGPAKISIYVGNAQQQVKITPIFQTNSNTNFLDKYAAP